MRNVDGGPGPGGPEKPPLRPWTPGEIESFTKELGSVIEKLGDKYIAFMREKWLHDVTIESAVAKADWKVLAILMLFLGVVIALVVVLVAIGKASGDSPLLLALLRGTSSPWCSGIFSRRRSKSRRRSRSRTRSPATLRSRGIGHDGVP
jgi:hypothetical protein